MSIVFLSASLEELVPQLVSKQENVTMLLLYILIIESGSQFPRPDFIPASHLSTLRGSFFSGSSEYWATHLPRGSSTICLLTGATKILPN